MKRAGRVHWLILTSLISAVAVIGILFSGKESPEQACHRWLLALAKHDIPTLVENTYMEGASKEEMTAAWTRTLNVSGPYYRFTWQMKKSSQPEPTRASVDVNWYKHADSPSTYAENYGIPMEKVDGKWKVDVRSITRDMFPGLPR